MSHPPDDVAGTRILHLGLDACDVGLVRRLAGEGRMPTFARLLADGRVVDTVAPYGTFVGSSWMTITTGTEVGTHGFCNWIELDPDTYERRLTSPRDVVPLPYWQHLSDAGKRVAVLDVPHAGVPTELHGALLKEWGCHDRHDGTASHPPSLLAELDQLVGRHPVGCADHPCGDEAFAPCDYVHRADRRRTPDEERRLLDGLLAGIEAKLTATRHVLEGGPWDLFTVVFGEAHCVGHQLWHVHDPSHPFHDPATRAMLGDPVAQVYEALDRAVGAVLAAAGPATTALVQLNHGMGAHYDADHLLDELLLRVDRSLAGAFHPGWRSRAAATVLDRLPAPASRLGRRAAARAVRHRADRHPPAISEPVGPRPDRRLLHVHGNTTVGAVRLNLRGRERHGLLAPGAERDAFEAAVRDALAEVVDIDTGNPLVRAVVRSDEVLTRSDGDRLPDLFVEWERSSLVERIWSPRIGTIVAPYRHWRSGDHVDAGVVVAIGPGIEPGRRPAPMGLVEVAPTICAALGVTIPGAEGVAQPDLLGRPGRPTAGGRGPLRSLVRPRPTRRTRPPRPDGGGAVAAGAIAHSTATARRVDELEHALATLRQRLDDTDRAAHDRSLRIARLERERDVFTTMAWLARHPADSKTPITVITPTYERPEKLARAIGSVLAQRHLAWELLVVDDGSATAQAVVEAFGDERIRVIDVPHGGPAAARNAGLAAATGEVVAYLDDDNTLDPGWLQAVAWAFAEHPEHDVLFGARLIDDDLRVHERGEGGRPWIHYEPYDRAGLLEGNSTDMGVIAHRAGHPAARFDVALWECADWDVFLALTAARPPLELPAIACCYTTDGSDRLTGRYREHADDVRRKWAALEPPGA